MIKVNIFPVFIVFDFQALFVLITSFILQYNNNNDTHISQAEKKIITTKIRMILNSLYSERIEIIRKGVKNIKKKFKCIIYNFLRVQKENLEK